MTLEFSNEAENDLEQIADYVARHNPQRALSLVRELRSKCEELIESPNGYAVVPRYEYHGIRRCFHGNYLIFYRVENTKVVIGHVPNGVTDYGPILFGD